MDERYLIDEGLLVKSGQIETAPDTTHSRERMASLPTQPRETRSPRTAFTIPERQDEGWTSHELERTAAVEIDGQKRSTFMSKSDGYYFSGVKQSKMLHGSFSPPFDEEEAKQTIRDSMPKLAKELFNHKPPSSSEDPKPAIPSEARSIPTTRDSGETSSARAPLAQSLFRDAYKRPFDGDFDGPFTSINNPENENERGYHSDTMSPPPHEPLAKAMRMEKILEFVSTLRQSERGQMRAPPNLSNDEQPEQSAAAWAPLPRLDSLERRRDLDEIARMDREREELAALMAGKKAEEEADAATMDPDDAFDKYNGGKIWYPERWGLLFGSYDYLKKGPAREEYCRQQAEEKAEAQKAAQATPGSSRRKPGGRSGGSHPAGPAGVRKNKGKGMAVHSGRATLHKAITGAMEEEVEDRYRASLHTAITGLMDEELEDEGDGLQGVETGDGVEDGGDE